MEEHVWYLVEKLINAELDEAGVKELSSLLLLYPELYTAVKDFLLNYEDEALPINKHAIKKFLADIAHQTDQRGQRNQNQPQKQQPQMYKRIRQEVEMAGHLLKIAVRNLQRNLGISVINITGLSVGIAGALLIMLWVQNQLSYDQFHVNKDRIYEVYNRTTVDGEMHAWGSTPMPLAPALKTGFDQVEDAIRLNWVGSFVLKNGDRKFESQGFTTDVGFFNFFSYPLLRGNPATALGEPRSIVLTEKMAQKLFGNADPMGKTVAIDSTADFVVTGLLKNLPANTGLSFDYLLPFSYMKEVHWYNDSWKNNAAQTFVMFKPGITEEVGGRLIKDIYRQYPGDQHNDAILQPMSKWWLYNRYENGHFVAGQMVIVRLFAIIALLIVLVACINYMNLGTARSTRRAKEVGVRKVAGAGRWLLIKQFLCESLLVTTIAAVIGLVLVQLALPWFNNLIGKGVEIPFNKPAFWLTGLAMIMVISVVAGSYPAFYLSAFRPAEVLKGKMLKLAGLVTPRKLLVVLQFTFAITFIISTLVIYRQISFAQKRDTGYKADNLVFLYMKGDMAKNYSIIKNELERSGAITSISRTTSPVLDNWTDNNNYTWEGKPQNAHLYFLENTTDGNFTTTFGLPLVAGREIDVAKYPSDTSAIMVTQTGAKQLGFKNPIGQIVRQENKSLLVVGVVKDYIAASPYIAYQPIIIRGAEKKFGAVTLKLNTANAVTDNINKISSIFKKYNSSYPFDFKFLDESYRERFLDEQHIGQLVGVFAGLSIFISCLGLFALAACVAESRIKEIGIRKVLGASVTGIATLLTKDFLALVLIAFVIASPIAWWLMSKWLQDYTYHAELSWWLFGATGLISVLIAVCTVGFQAVKAAIANPVNSLKTE